MVEETSKDNKKFYKCEECGLLFNEEKWMIACADWDKKYHACSTEIAKHAIK